MNRQQANMQLLQILSMLIGMYPDQRFGQILSNFDFVEAQMGMDGRMGWVDGFHVEPSHLLVRVKQAVLQHAPELYR